MYVPYPFLSLLALLPVGSLVAVPGARPARSLTARSAHVVTYTVVTRGVKPVSARPRKPVQIARAAPVSAWESASVEIIAAGRGRINYEAGVVKAVGLGALAPPTLARSRAQDTLDAREAAVTDALRTLSLAVSRVRVTANTRVENYVTQSDEVRLRVDAVVQSAQVIDESISKSGLYRVVVQAPLSGAGSVSEAVGVDRPQTLKAEAGTVIKEPLSATDAIGPGSPPPTDAKYTGLIVDCRGLNVSSCMSPKVFAEDGGEVYGTMHVSPEYVIETGIVGYPRSMEDARVCHGWAGTLLRCARFAAPTNSISIRFCRARMPSVFVKRMPMTASWSVPPWHLSWIPFIDRHPGVCGSL